MIQNCIIFLCLSCLVRFNAFRYNIRQQSWSKFSIPSSISKRSSQRIMETQRLESNKLKSSIANIQTIRSRNRIFEQLLRFVKWNEFFPRISSIVISLVEPTVAGGVLSGGLHAISGCLILTAEDNISNLQKTIQVPITWRHYFPYR